jgi:CRISPR-associated protein Csh1
MLEAMRRLALDYLWIELDSARHHDPEVWYRELRQNDLARLFPKLVEDVEDSSTKGKDTRRYYTLRADPDDPDVAVLEAHEFKPGDATRLPFNQPSGSQSAALGPVIKRTPRSKTREAGPSVKIQETTLGAFEGIARAASFHRHGAQNGQTTPDTAGGVVEAGPPWSAYFCEAHACFKRKTLRFGGSELREEGEAFRTAIKVIDEKQTVLLAFQDARGRLPGEVPEYVDYLQNVLARTKYATGQNAPCPDRSCALCGATSTTIFPNALRGAGINLANLDRDGAFPAIDPMAAWKGYSLCVACADLLYVYWNHVASDFLVTVAGDKALIVPETSLIPSRRHEFIKRARELAQGIDKAEIRLRERRLLNLLSDDKVVTTVSFLWAEFGQRIDNIQGVVTDVLPSRLSELTRLNAQFKDKNHPLFPEVSLDEFNYDDLTLQVVRPLLRRPGGKKAQTANDSRRLFDLRRDLAEAIYHRATQPERFWDEVHRTARWHWDDVCAQGKIWHALHEGFSVKMNVGYLTLAGWVRQLNRFLVYLRHVGVIMPVLQEIYQPQSEVLKPYFTPESGIDSKEKAFAFILGVLYGKLLQVQAGRGVNVGANALTWLRRLSLSGRDLAELYVKVREKLLTYGTEGSPAVRGLLTELGELGTHLGDRINLGEIPTCYFLLLGQSLVVKILPSKDRDDSEGADQ